MSTLELVEEHVCFEGRQQVWQHRAETTACDMRFAVYLPPQAGQGPCPVLYWLSGLTCTEQNVITKSGFQRYAAELGLVVVCPDTSPRGEQVADDDAYDLGQGAGFYLNATQAPWSDHFRMYDYVVSELPALIEANFPVADRRGISGHSMGGHGALVVALKNPDRYASVSAFAPIVAPSKVPWGEKAFTAYLGDNRDDWLEWDACELLRAYGGDRSALPILVDQGDADDFLESQLRPELLEAVCSDTSHPLSLHRRPGYDNSYYFIASQIGAHLHHHAAAWKTSA